MKVTRTISIDPLSGETSLGTNLWDWDTGMLISVLKTCWDKDIVDKVKKILKIKQQKLNKILNESNTN